LSVVAADVESIIDGDRPYPKRDTLGVMFCILGLRFVRSCDRTAATLF
jgi:hypothetical protein